MLESIVQKDGKFIYTYYADKDTSSAKYNIVRHAGTVYSMMELYEHNPSENLLKAIKTAIRFLIKSIHSCPKPYQNTLCLYENDYTKLGGNALAAVALVKYISVTEDKTHIKLLKKLCDRIISVQKKSGEFSIHKQNISGELDQHFISSYYPGEAILALVRMYSIDKDPKWLLAAERGAEWLIQVRDKDLDINRLNHDHWFLYALNDLYSFQKKKLFLDHAKRMVDSHDVKSKYASLKKTYLSPRT